MIKYHLGYGIAKELVQSTLGKYDAINYYLSDFGSLILIQIIPKEHTKYQTLPFIYMQNLGYYTSFWACWNSSRFIPMDLSYPDDSYPGSDISYPTLWTIRTQQIMTQDQVNYFFFIFLIYNK